jgi:hypothetical protein
MEAIRQHNIERAEGVRLAAEAQAAKDYAKLVKSKKSRGIVVSRLHPLQFVNSHSPGRQKSRQGESRSS